MLSVGNGFRYLAWTYPLISFPYLFNLKLNFCYYEKLMFLVAASLFCILLVQRRWSSSEVNLKNCWITFELSAVNGLTDGIGTRIPGCIARLPTACHSRQCLCFARNGSTYLHQKTYDITNGPVLLSSNFAVPMLKPSLRYISFWLLPGVTQVTRFSVTRRL